MKAQQLENGMVGLGVMGRNLLLNMADHGHSVAGYDKDAAKVAALRFGEVKVETHGEQRIFEVQV
jgi:6-phosphogluconate dehydrogenase